MTTIDTMSTAVRYASPPTPQALAARLGMSVDRLCKLDANESPYGPPPAALAALAGLVRTAQAPFGAGRYPDPSASELRGSLAEYTGVAPEGIVVGNGSDELIHLLIDLLLEPGDEVVVAEPTFSLYALASRRRGASVIDAGCDGEFSVAPERIASAMTPRTRLVFLCAPNNPTGTPLPRGTLMAALERAEALTNARGGPLIIVDEAYYEIGSLAGDARSWTAAPLAAESPRLVVLRTFSKLFGLAGLRVGYALCAPELAERLRTLKQPYNVNVAGQLAARAALAEMAWLRERALALAAERERLARALRERARIGAPLLHVYPSAANFLLLQIAGASALPVWEALLDRGVMVRRFTDEQLGRYLRVTVGTPDQNDRLLEALRESLEMTHER